MVSVLASGLSSLGWSPGEGHFVVFLGNIFYYHSASLHPGVQLGTGKFNYHPIQGERVGRNIPSCFMLMLDK